MSPPRRRSEGGGGAACMAHGHTVPSSGASPRTIAQMGRGKPLYGPFFCQWSPQPRSTGNGSRGQGSGLCPLVQGPRWGLSTRTPRRMAGAPHPIFRSRFGGALAREGVVGPSRLGAERARFGDDP